MYWDNQTVYVDFTKYYNLLLNLDYPAIYMDKYIHIISNKTRYLQLVKNNGENNIETSDFTWNETEQIYISNDYIH